MRKQLAKTLDEIMTFNSQVVVLIGDISHYLLTNIEDKFKNRFYNLGIAEQTLIGLASGLSLEGKLPIVHTIAPFCTERVYEQIKLDIGYQNVEVIIISVGASFDYAHMGCSHHCTNDISILRVVPNLDIYIPGSSFEFDDIIKKTIGNGRAKYIKLTSREHNQTLDILPHEMKIVKKGNDNKLIITTGHMLKDIIDIEQDSTIYYTNSITNLEVNSIEHLINDMKGKEIFVVEENNVVGGLGDAIFDLTKNKLNKIGIPNAFLDHYGTYDEQREFLGLTPHLLKKTIYGN